MIQERFSARGVGRIYVYEGRMSAQKHLKVMDDKLFKSDWEFYKSEECVFQQDNAPCRTARVCKCCFNTHILRDLYSIENLW